MTIVIRLMMAAALAMAMSGQALAAPKGTATSAVSKGFVTVAWGEDVSKREGFMKLRSQDGVDYYVNLRERFEMKGFSKPTVFYGQAGGRLYAVHLRLSEGDSYQRLVAELNALYGKGKQSRADGGDTTRWKAGPVRVKLKKDAQAGPKLSFYYQPVASTLDPLLREADPSTDELDRMLPADQAGVKAPSGPLPRKEEQVGIDVLKYLKEGREALRPRTSQ